MKLPKLYSIFIGIGILIITFFFIRELNENTRYRQNSKIKVSINEWAGYAPLVYAKEIGLFEKNNIDVEIILMPGQAESNEKFINDEVDAVCTVTSDALMINANGVDGKIVLFTDYSVTGDVIVANPKIKSVKDLRKKIIGIDSLNGFSHLLVLNALKANGISEKEVEFKIIPYTEIANAIKSNSIDAGHTWNPGKNLALKSGAKVIFTAGEIPGLISDTITFKQDYIKQNPEVVEKFKSIFYQAQQKMLENPQDATMIVSKFFKNDPKEFYESFSEIHFINEKENSELFNFQNEVNGQQLLSKYSQFYLERGQISDPNLFKKIMLVRSTI